MRSLLFSLCFMVLLAASNVSSTTLTEDKENIIQSTTTLQPPRTLPASVIEQARREFQQYLNMLDILDERRNLQQTQIDEIGSTFNILQILTLLKRDSQVAFQRKCKKISGDDNGYVESMEAKDQIKVCIANWTKSEEIPETYYYAKMSQNYKPFIKKICNTQSGLFECIDTYSEAFKGCFYPKEIEIAQKTNKIVKNMLELICSNNENDFTLYDVKGEALQCFNSNQIEVKTCANKAIYLVAKRILEKWIENEHFKLETENEDCKVFNTIENCFISSVGNCTSPKMENMIMSAFQIVVAEDTEAQTFCFLSMLFD